MQLGRYLLTGLISLGGWQARAQNAGNDVFIGADAPPPGPKACVQMQIAGQKGSAYNCLNQELQQQAQTANPAPAAPLGANSPANATGTFNKAGIAEQYGENFGKSVIPYRPPPPAFSNPLH